MSEYPLQIIAHRCRGFGAAENSYKALEHALRSQVDAVELDVRVSRDGKFVVSHDPWFRDRDGKLHVVGRCSMAELESLDLLPLETAASLFKEISPAMRLALDIKIPGREVQLINLLRRLEIGDRVLIISWHKKILQRIHCLAPELPLSYSLFQYFVPILGCPLIPWPFPPRFLKKRQLPLESINVVPVLFPLQRIFVERLRNTGSAVNAVVSNLPRDIALFSRWGISGIFTSCAGLFSPDTPAAHAREGARALAAANQ